MSEPRPSASICLMSGSDVLMVRRSPAAGFMAGAWVFPGGLIEDGDRDEQARRLLTGNADSEQSPWLIAALRELAEEVGIYRTRPRIPAEPGPIGRDVLAEIHHRGARFDGSHVAHLATWVTPGAMPQRFATRLFVGTLPARAETFPDGVEIVDAQWIESRAALDRFTAGDIDVPFPTRKTLELLDRLGDGDRAVAYAASLDEVPVMEPVLVVGEDGDLMAHLPGDSAPEAIR